MASSNRHWPSMFKSKPCNSHHQWQHEINPSLITGGLCHRAPFTSVVGGCDERSPEPKPRWNPKPEQIRILEAIFNSGMVNPPRDEIRRIRAQLQEYGQVGDANVFYWFQNRKSRSKHKLRHLQTSKHHHSNNPQTTTTTAPSSSSSSSSENKTASPKAPARGFSSNLATRHDHHQTSPTASVNNQTIFQTNNVNSHEFLSPTDHHFFFPAPTTTTTTSQGFCFPQNHELSHEIGPCTSLLLSEIMNHNHHHYVDSKKDHDLNNYHKNLMKMSTNDDGHSHQFSYASLTPTPRTPSNVVVSSTTTSTTVSAPPVPVNQIQDQGVVGPPGGGAANNKTMVFINDVAFEVAEGPFNVREAFGEDAVLIHANGQLVPTDEWGVTPHSLHHGAFYYLI
ncbi:WUSCHEL-related homeobox 8-like isoform X2 [Humulus lupulus]|uniref:WUSCHEL-related homeobox 8-like isoform X2 n=1 Tax=Humulus lupulus TaxID=3486 RepID=UPI002B402945|nr:WUSCHEL-related homeobox 8-like isoform X2 [Humulus lupulus]